MNPFDSNSQKIINPFSLNKILQNPFGQMGVEYTKKQKQI
jgi:hypothetical protein